ncbi:MAG: family 43 glycosylhydrolase, partial [Spirochaetales bacterium]|nr:family 43 glycosylhydrolase [Spirochaetales bacterium]
TLFVDDSDVPWIVFCHEWVQIGDGAIYAMALTEDLSAPAGDPVLLFNASEADWPKKMERRDGSGIVDARVTDGPFLHRQEDGELYMLWSSHGPQGYAMGCARSDSKEITGPWTQIESPLVSKDGGHGMVFRDFDGKLQITWHSPNVTPLERFVYHEVKESSRGLVPAGKGEVL